MVRFQTVNGEATNSDDPNRLLFYGMCGYWTDDWSKLKTTGGIPCCPVCGAVGFQATAEDWFDGAVGYEEDGHPRYVEWLKSVNGTCHHRKPFNKIFAEWLAAQEKTP